MVEEALIVVMVKFKCIQPLKSNKSLVNDYLTWLGLLLFSENGNKLSDNEECVNLKII